MGFYLSRLKLRSMVRTISLIIRFRIASVVMIRRSYLQKVTY